MGMRKKGQKEARDKRRSAPDLVWPGLGEWPPILIGIVHGRWSTGLVFFIFSLFFLYPNLFLLLFIFTPCALECRADYTYFLKDALGPRLFNHCMSCHDSSPLG